MNNDCLDLSACHVEGAQDRQLFDSNVIKELLEVAMAFREYIDALPDGIELPAMPGLDRDWADSVIGQAQSRVANEHVGAEATSAR